MLLFHAFDTCISPCFLWESWQPIISITLGRNMLPKTNCACHRVCSIPQMYREIFGNKITTAAVIMFQVHVMPEFPFTWLLTLPLFVVVIVPQAATSMISAIVQHSRLLLSCFSFGFRSRWLSNSKLKRHHEVVGTLLVTKEPLKHLPDPPWLSIDNVYHHPGTKGARIDCILLHDGT